MHKKIYPIQDTYIENSSTYYLKDLSRTEILNISAIDSTVQTLNEMILLENINQEIINFNVSNFSGSLIGFNQGTAKNINGTVISCEGVIVPDSVYVPSASLQVYLQSP